MDILVLAAIVIAQQCVIIGLVNRVLFAKGVSPLRIPKMFHDDLPETAAPRRPKPLMTIPINL